MKLLIISISLGLLSCLSSCSYFVPKQQMYVSPEVGAAHREFCNKLGL